MLLNIGVFGTGLFLFDRQSVVYSILMAGVMYLCLDRVHLQNVMVAMFIITKREDMEKLVFPAAGRGVTRWGGGGRLQQPGDGHSAHGGLEKGGPVPAPGPSGAGPQRICHHL